MQKLKLLIIHAQCSSNNPFAFSTHDNRLICSLPINQSRCQKMKRTDYMTGVQLSLPKRYLSKHWQAVLSKILLLNYWNEVKQHYMDKDIHLFASLIMIWWLGLCGCAQHPGSWFCLGYPTELSHRPDVGGLFTVPSTTLPAYIRKVPSHYIWQIHNLRFKCMKLTAWNVLLHALSQPFTTLNILARTWDMNKFFPAYPNSSSVACISFVKLTNSKKNNIQTQRFVHYPIWISFKAIR